MKLVAPFGHFGWGNIGDEATLLGFARLLSKTGNPARVSVGSRNPAHTARVEPAFRYFHPEGDDPRRWWAKIWASAYAFVGGTPIMDVLGRWPLCKVAPLVRSVDRWNVPIAFIGVGIEDLKLEESRRIVTEEIAPRVQHWSVRCDRDRKRLIEYGVLPDVITVAADMAWLLEPATAEFGEYHLQKWGLDSVRPLIGVNLVNENAIFDREPQMLNALAVALDELAGQMDARVIFLANEIREDSTFDKAAAQKVISQMKRADRTVLAPNDYFTPQQMMSLVSCCDLTISMRYHFCMFSALQGVPFIAIERSDKVSDLCWDMRWPARVVPPVFDASEIVEHACRMKQDASAIDRQLSHEVRKMADRSLQNVAALNALANGRPADIAQRIRITVVPILKKFMIKG